MKGSILDFAMKKYSSHRMFPSDIVIRQIKSGYEKHKANKLVKLENVHCISIKSMYVYKLRNAKSKTVFRFQTSQAHWSEAPHAEGLLRMGTYVYWEWRGENQFQVCSFRRSDAPGPNSASPSLTGYRLEVGFEPATSSQETPLLAPRLEVINR